LTFGFAHETSFFQIFPNQAFSLFAIVFVRGWIADIPVSARNVHSLATSGRAIFCRWRMANLKSQPEPGDRHNLPEG
jgi:hypothetical protein